MSNLVSLTRYSSCKSCEKTYITCLTLLCIVIKNGQEYFNKPVMFTPKDFQSMFGYFSTLYMKGLISQTIDI